MSIDDYPRLCGGTFFTLVLQALRQRMKAREHYAGDSDGLSDSEVMVGLIKVINLDYVDPGKGKLKTIVNNYKRCETSTSAYLPFGDDQVVAAFDDMVRTDYQTALNGMIGFVNDFLDMSEAVHKDVNLVRASSIPSQMAKKRKRPHLATLKKYACQRSCSAFGIISL